MKPFWVTFYSYKGGVGRSLALANIAALLVKGGRRVLLIDFDLEAPGLDSFCEFKAASKQPGVVEYVSEFIRKKTAPDITNYVHHCELPGHLRGKLWLMPAGRKDGAYNHQLTRINWTELYEEGMGKPFFENWKAAIEANYQPDFVFVDSRTGLTEIGGVCTTQFPDLVVMLFSLNEQNVQGSATVAKFIREADIESAPHIHFVATPVPNLPQEQRVSSTQSRSYETRGLLQQRIDFATECLGTKNLSELHYFAPAALFEKLFVLEEQKTHQVIISDYMDLRSEIVEFNRTGLDVLLEQFDDSLTENDFERAAKIVSVLTRNYPDRAECFFASCRLEHSQGHSDQSVKLATKALAIDIAYEEPSTFLTSYYTRSRNWTKLAALLDKQIQAKAAFNRGHLATIYQARGEVMMTLRKYQEAESSYRLHKEIQDEQKYPAEITLISQFNVAESHRRSEKTIVEIEWRKVLNLFLAAGAASYITPNQQANFWQAIHIAYACCGELQGARDALKKAQRIAMTVGEVDDIFTVKDYMYVTVTEFLSINNKMLLALEKGRLWDGMKLKSSD